MAPAPPPPLLLLLLLLALFNLSIASFVLFRLTERYTWQRITQTHWVEAVLLIAAVATAAEARILDPRKRRVVAISAALVAVLLCQYVFCGGARYAPQVLVSGRASVAWWCVRPETNVRNVVSFYVKTSRVGSPRHVSFSARMRALGLDEIVEAVPDTPDNPFTDKCPRSMWGMTDLFVKASRAKKWIAVFEDDAVPHWDFVRQLGCALDSAEASGAEALMMDARTDVTYRFGGQYFNGALIAWSSYSFDTVTHEMQRFVAHNSSWTGKIQPVYDQLWSAMCRAGELNCMVRPLVSESGEASTIMNAAETCFGGWLHPGYCGLATPSWC